MNTLNEQNRETGVAQKGGFDMKKIAVIVKVTGTVAVTLIMLCSLLSAEEPYVSQTHLGISNDGRFFTMTGCRPVFSEGTYYLDPESVEDIPPEQPLIKTYWARDLATSASGDLLCAYRYRLRCTGADLYEDLHRVEIRLYEKDNDTSFVPATAYPGPVLIDEFEQQFSPYSDIDRSISVDMADRDNFLVCWNEINQNTGSINMYGRFSYEGDWPDRSNVRLNTDRYGTVHTDPVVSFRGDCYTVIWVVTDPDATPSVRSRVVTRRFSMAGVPLTDEVVVHSFCPAEYTPNIPWTDFHAADNADGSTVLLTYEDFFTQQNYQLNAIGLNKNAYGVADVAAYGTIQPMGRNLRYVAASLPGRDAIKIIDQTRLTKMLYQATNGYIKESELSPPYQDLITHVQLPDYTEGPTALTIAEVIDPDTGEEKTMAFVAVTYTTGQNKLLFYEVNGNTWTPYTAIPAPDLGSPGVPQFADMELRADNQVLYIALPEADKIYPFNLSTFVLGLPITATHPTDLALVPYYENPRLGNINRLRDIINQTPDEAFDTPTARDLLLNELAQLEAEIEQPAVIDTIEDTMGLRSFITEHVLNETYQGFMIDALDAVLMILVNEYINPENPVTSTTIMATVVNDLPSTAFTNPGSQNQIVNKTNDLEQKLTTDKYYLALDRINEIEQLINDHVIDQAIMPILTSIIDGVKSKIVDIYQVFDNGMSINNSVNILVESLDDEVFANNGGRSEILNKSSQLNNMLEDRKLDQSLTKLTQLEDAIDQMIIDDETRNLLLERTGEIRSLLEGL